MDDVYWNDAMSAVIDMAKDHLGKDPMSCCKYHIDTLIKKLESKKIEGYDKEGKAD